MNIAIDLLIILVLLLGFSQFRAPGAARRGNLAAAFALSCAFVLVLARHATLAPGLVLSAIFLGGVLGWLVAVRINMIQIPAMVAFQHGAGGIAACLIAFLELTRAAGGSESALGEISGLLGLIIGTATFSGSMVAGGKLAGLIVQKPVALPFHSLILAASALLVLGLATIAGQADHQAALSWLVILIGLSVVLGILFAIRIGGADMPVLISFLNATAGLAAAFCGVIIQNRLLIACGATVAASGSILTHVMCKAMNRGLSRVFVGSASAQLASPASIQFNEVAPETTTETDAGDPYDRAVSALGNADSIVIVPGYGMALAQAQFQVVNLAKHLEEQGKSVKFAIHPVAGRMPGHMNVLLAEAEADYEKLVEMDQINPELADTDVALVVGACDVVNPAAIAQEGTPISGMPILVVHDARTVIVCNIDDKPGYSGVNNPLYEMPKTIALFGDARESLDRLIGAL